MLQREFGRYPGRGYPGDLARPDEPHAFDIGLARVPAGGRAPRPGDAVYYDEVNDRFAVPTNAAQQRAVIGIVSYDPGKVAGTVSPLPDDGNSDVFVEYADGEEIKVGVLGTFWVTAGSAMKYGQPCSMATDDFKWDSYVPDLDVPAGAVTRQGLIDIVEELRRRVSECVSPAPVAADGLAQVRIGFGRVI